MKREKYVAHQTQALHAPVIIKRAGCMCFIRSRDMWKIVDKTKEFRLVLENFRKMRKEIEQEHLKIKE